jgi:hypothetical protein
MSEEFDDAITEEVSRPETEARGVTIEDFVAYMPGHTYIFTPSREIWAGASVDARLAPMPVLDQYGQPRRNKRGKLITMSPTRWLDQNRPVEQMTWCPSLPMLIRNRLVVAGGWIERPEVTTFNLYQPPRLLLGEAAKAEPWLRISEARDLGEVDRFSFYDRTKIYTAAPPDVLRVDEKNLREHYVFNCLGLLITTNHKRDGIYLPADDRRHYVAWSNCTKEEFSSSMPVARPKTQSSPT